ncbi:MAG: PD-(D/E)XK nuclease domain-containing protein, partial [Elusimicrobiota bacterium]|nr:PD-(D/E)XK nuclease domain-containing protein [Elusimicrobiota bacterium]
EHFYHANCISLFVGNGIRILAGDKGKVGNPDIIIFYKNTAVVCELKYAKAISQADKKLEEAIKQIRDKKYYEKYELEAEKILLLGIVFIDMGVEVRCRFEEL